MQDRLLLSQGRQGFCPGRGRNVRLCPGGGREGRALRDVVFLVQSQQSHGNTVKKEEVEQLADTCERLGAYLAVDECFCDFLDNSESYSVIPDLARFTHLFVLKAFTKLYAMAGYGWATAFAATGAFWNGFRQYASPGPCPARPSALAWRPLRRILRSTP